MTRAQVQPERCSVCRGKHFLLSNRNGLVHARFCDCFHCETCGGSGRVFLENEKGAAFLADCVSCTALRKRFRILDEAGIPGKFAHAEFETFMKHHNSQGIAKRVAMDFVADVLKSQKDFNRGLIFMGNPGLGKTHLAVSIMKALILEQGVDCKFVDFFQLLSDIRHGYSEDMSDKAFMTPYLKARVLVIDELAKGRNTEWELTVLDQLISSRYNAANKVTVFTTNYPSEKRIGTQESYKDASEKNYADTYTRESLQEKIGARIYSRLAEMCKFVMIEGQDHRQKTLSASQRYPQSKR